MRIFPKKPLYSLGFSVAILLLFCILLGAEGRRRRPRRPKDNICVSALQNEPQEASEQLEAVYEEEAAACEEEAAACEEEAAACEEEAAIRVGVAALCVDIAALREENAALSADIAALRADIAPLQFHLDRLDRLAKMRQLFNNFRGEAKNGRNAGPGVVVDKELQIWAKSEFPQQYDRGHSVYFSNTVVSSEERRRELKARFRNLDRNELKEFNAKTEELRNLKLAAMTFKTKEMRWDSSIGEGFYALCVLAAHANEEFHPAMTEQLLDDMSSRADRGEYTYVGVEMKDAVKAIIKKLRAS